MDKESKIYVAGHTGMVGSAICRELNNQGYENLIVVSHHDLDLRNQQATLDFFMKEKPDYVFMAAATVGGVFINNIQPARFMYDNLAIAINTLDAAFKAGVKKLLYMGSGCVYPKITDRPMIEDDLLSAPLEKTNEAYAIAKISGIKMCEFYNRQYGTNFISCMPCNAYGPGDNYDPDGSHVVPALIRKAYTAKQKNAESIVMWGTGTPVREFIYIDDIANACIFLMNNYDGNECLNIGTGKEITIEELTRVVCDVVGFKGQIIKDLSKPDGTPRKLLDSSKIFNLGWRPCVDFDEGMKITFNDFIKNESKYLKEYIHD